MPLPPEQIDIQLNVSFIVAVVLLVLALVYRRKWRVNMRRTPLPVA